MKKLFNLLVAGTVMLCGAFCNNAEALRHYHHQGADGQEDSVLFFNEDFAYDEGFAMEVNHTNTETNLLYLGNWKREPSGYIGVKHDLMKVRDGNGKITQEKVGIRQQYGPNPRVNEVRQKLRCDL